MYHNFINPKKIIDMENQNPIPDRPFLVRSYLKQDLAQLYFPQLSPASALKKLRKWISFNPELHRRLYSGREGRNDQSFSHRQVQLLVDYLEEP